MTRHPLIERTCSGLRPPQAAHVKHERRLSQASRIPLWVDKRPSSSQLQTFSATSTNRERICLSSAKCGYARMNGATRLLGTAQR
jgi:hypothetical protein